MEYQNLREKYGDVKGLVEDAYGRIRRRMGSMKERVTRLEDCFGSKQLLEMTV